MKCVIITSVPTSCPCGRHERDANIPEGMIHPAGTDCPFADYPRAGITPGTCCSLVTEFFSQELELAGHEDIAQQMWQDMTAEEAIGLADDLRRTASLIKKIKHKGVVRNMRLAADWFERLGQLGFGIRNVDLEEDAS